MTIDLRLGSCLEILPTLGRVDAVVSDPPYGMKWDTDSTRFSGGRAGKSARGRKWGRIEGDDVSFDPTPWLQFPKVILFGANHYASKLPVGTTLVWIKKHDHLLGTFLSDAEIAWMKGGHGVYVFHKPFPTPCRIKEGGLKKRAAHPTLKPVALMRWCIERLKLKPGATILDPYMGSGSTGVAAAELGFNFIGIESHAPYFDTANRRLDEARIEAA